MGGWTPNEERMIHYIQTESAEVTIPDWVVDLESFRRWIDADDVPEKAHIAYLNNGVWIDMSKEQVFTHVLVKTKFTMRLGNLVELGELGLFLGDGARLINLDADFSVRPDCSFASNESLSSGRVKLVEGSEEGYLELEGTPDMVLEVVSPTSLRKDTEIMRQRYAEAGIREYWLVDARKDPLSFDILRLTSRGYVATRKQQGWVRSVLFDKSFRLLRKTTALGHPDFTLEMR
jgi:Uma2 family endonuclease